MVPRAEGRDYSAAGKVVSLQVRESWMAYPPVRADTTPGGLTHTAFAVRPARHPRRTDAHEGADQVLAHHAP